MKKMGVFQWGSVFFLILGIMNIGVSWYLREPHVALWFCSATIFLFALGLYLENNFLLSASVVSAFVIEMIWLVDMVSFLLTGNLFLGIANYLYSIASLRFYMTFYHIFLLIFPIVAVFTQKRFHRFAWMGASIYMMIILCISIFFPGNVNCVRVPCNLGVFSALDYLYVLLSGLPVLIMNWILYTVVLFIPTNFIFSFLFYTLYDRKIERA